MRISYRGFDLEAKRERSLGGDIWCYWSAYRQSDGWCLTESSSDDTMGDMIDILKDDVDSYYANPDEWEGADR